MGMNDTNTATRATKGGQVGMNGEFYAGGTFLPNTTLTKMARRTPGTGSRKQIIAPFVWEAAPEGKTSLFAMFRDFVDIRTGVVNQQACMYYNRNPEVMADLFVLWCDGERWMLA